MFNNAALPLFHSVLSPGHSSEGGPVVDLTYDSGVEDEELVDLTSPVRVRGRGLEGEQTAE